MGRRVKSKYPGQYDDFIEVSISSVSAEYLSPQASSGFLTPQVFEDTKSEPITAEDTKTLYRIASVVLFIVCAFLVLSVFSADTGAGVLTYIVLGAGAAMTARTLWRKADEAYEHEAKEIALKTEVKKNQIAFKSELVREKQAESEATRNLELVAMRQDTQARTEHVNQTTLDRSMRTLSATSLRKLLTSRRISTTIHRHQMAWDISILIRNSRHISKLSPIPSSCRMLRSETGYCLKS